jgi:RNA polymerase sigma-70 factor (family 1)
MPIGQLSLARNQINELALQVATRPYLSVQSTDTEWIEAIRQGDERAFERVFRTYYTPLCHYAATFLKDPDDAEEMVQNFFVTLWERKAFIEINVSLKSYLYRSVHNHCLNRLKHLKIQDTYRQHNATVIEQSPTSATDRLYAIELQRQLDRAIERLPEQCRAIFKMSRFDELKYSEIAEQLGLSVKTVENQIGKALKILRSQLADYLPIVVVWVLNLIL